MRQPPTSGLTHDPPTATLRTSPRSNPQERPYETIPPERSSTQHPNKYPYDSNFVSAAFFMYHLLKAAKGLFSTIARIKTGTTNKATNPSSIQKSFA